MEPEVREKLKSELKQGLIDRIVLMERNLSERGVILHRLEVIQIIGVILDFQIFRIEIFPEEYTKYSETELVERKVIAVEVVGELLTEASS